MRLAAVLLPLLACAAHAAHAQVCSASATGLSFPPYDPFAPTPAAITGTVTVTCRATVATTVSYAVQLGPGASGGPAARSMTNGIARLTYQLFTDPARTSAWGDGTGGTAAVTDAYALAALATLSRTYTIYGAIPPRQLVAPGAYADVVAVLIVY